MTTLTLNIIKDAIAGNAAAFRVLTRLIPSGGEGDKVFRLPTNTRTAT